MTVQKMTIVETIVDEMTEDEMTVFKILWKTSWLFEQK